MSRQETIEAVIKQAAENGETAKIINLLERGAPFVVDMDGQTVLHLAAMGGHVDTVEALLDRGCDANIQDFCGHTSLQRAAAGGHLEIAKLLLEHGATVDHQDELYGNTALHEAAWKGFSRTVSLLCKRRGNVYIKNRGGFTPLHLSCQNGHNQSCRNILITGCKPDLKNDYGDTPIHTAARYGHAGVIRILVSANCKVSEQNKNGDTALHIAAAMGRKKLTRILLEIGINRNLRNKQGETALDIAMRKSLTDIIDIFQSIAIQPKSVVIENRNNKDDHLFANVDEIKRASEKQQQEDRGNNVDSVHRCQPDQTKAMEIEAEKLRSRQDHHRVNFKQHADTDLSEVSALDKLDAIKTLNKDLKRRQQKSANKSVHSSHEPKYPARRSEPSRASRAPCDCVPILEKIGRRLEDDKRQIMGHINDRSRKLDDRLENLELKTKKQISNFHQTMKECFAEERSDCQTRMDRLTLKERIELERQQAIRDIMLKRDIARWLQAKMLEIEKGLGSAPENKAILRKLTRRKSRRETRSMLSDIKNGTLRRTNSVELVSEVGESDDLDSANDKTDADVVHTFRGLKISSKPTETKPSVGGVPTAGPRTLPPGSVGEPRPRRVRHNSDGNYDDINLMQETILSVRRKEDSIYENLMPLYSTQTHQLPVSEKNPPKFTRKSARQLNFVNESCENKLITPPLSSDTSSIDSHNDSGYSTRIAVSEGPSPPLFDVEPMLDPQALYMIPPEINKSDSGFINYSGDNSPNNKQEFRINDVVINPKSSFV